MEASETKLSDRFLASRPRRIRLAQVLIVLALTGLVTGGVLLGIKRVKAVRRARAAEFVILSRRAAAPFPLSPNGILPYDVVEAFPKLRFKDPTYIAELPDGSGRLLVIERTGRILTFDKDAGADATSVYLDITDRTMYVKDRAEDGLFCIAFHPQFTNPESPHRGEVFVHYTANVNDVRFNRVSRFRARPDGGSIDPASEEVLIGQEDKNQSHNGGTLTFGADGFLYIGFGDDNRRPPETFGQRINESFFAGICRLDVDCQGGEISHPPLRQPKKGATAHYYIPNDNPFVGMPDALEEFYAIGLRNPWRMAFDSPTGRLWVSDVGDHHREEINLVTKGSNCCWPYAEGTILRTSILPDGLEKPENYLGTETWPVLEYDRKVMHRCVIGGSVYRGSKFPDLVGRYVYADQNGHIYALSVDDSGKQIENRLVAVVEDPGLGISSFGTNQEGELYICCIRDLDQPTGLVFELSETRPDVAKELPKRLSETGLFADVENLLPSDRLIAYDVQVPFWSDRAQKLRWIRPVSGQRVTGDTEGPWHFPAGTLFVKHFDIALDEREPTVTRRIETRVLVCDDQQRVYGATYRWREDQSDADLIGFTETELIEYVDQKGAQQKQTWTYPGRMECVACHNAVAGYVLGFSPKQLNHEVMTSRGPVHQLRILMDRGVLGVPLSPRHLKRIPKLVDPGDEHASLEHRVRSYLDANCSYCHRPGHRFGQFDARIDKPLNETGIVDEPAHMHQVYPDPRVVHSGRSDKSFLLIRLSSGDGVMRMPPLGSNITDPQGIELVTRWINSLTPAPIAEKDGKSKQR